MAEKQKSMNISLKNKEKLCFCSSFENCAYDNKLLSMMTFNVLHIKVKLTFIFRG